MFRKVLFRDFQQLLASDIQAAEQEAQDYADLLVLDAIEPGSKFSGFSVSRSSATEIGVTAGRLTVAGKRYIMDQPTTLDLISYLPVTTRKKVAVCLGYQEVNDTEAVRNFMTDTATRQYEPRTVAMRSSRRATLAVYPGTENSDPALPNIPVGTLHIATVTLSTTGIELDGIEMVETNRLRTLKGVDDDVTVLENWRQFIQNLVSTLVSDIAGLAIQSAQKADTAMVLRIAEETARIREKIDEPDSGTVAGRDNFLDETETDTAYSGYAARIEDGLTFPSAASNTTGISLSTPNDPKVAQLGNVVLPAFTNVNRITVDGKVDAVNISQYTITNRDFVKKTKARLRFRYGVAYLLRSSTAYYFQGRYDPTGATLRIGGDTWNTIPYVDQVNVLLYRRKWVWLDKYKQTYWKAITSTTTVNGANVAQSFLNSQDGWLTRIHLYFTQLQSTGDLTLGLCELTDAGTPDRDNTLFTMSVARNTIATGWNAIPVPYTYLDKGKRYAVVLLTAAAHYVGLANGGALPGGTFFQSVDDAYYQGILGRDMMMKLDFAQFNQNRVEVDLAPLELSGGMNAIDVLGQMVAPEGSSLVFEARKVGETNWNPITDETQNWLTGLPTQLAFRAVFIGTKDVMPAIDMLDTKVTVWRPATALKHASSLRTPGGTVNTVYVRVGLENFDAGHHTLTVKIDRAGTLETHDALVSTTGQGANNQATVERYYTFNLAAGTTSYKVVIEATTDSADRPFAINYRADASA